ncbi:MAG TPA: hypothetical protein DCZ95_10725 [Verrucomicrobia bacterium]|nr:MAG: hypothetical protein A2X46_18420 [Lentisphaerae bacterium GWF2_57_35]HBA84557.1 hypothetical protein [Verrucomicrobiota bacterium]
MRSFTSLFEPLAAQASCRHTIPIMSARLNLFSSDAELLNDFAHTFVDLDFTGHQAGSQSMECGLAPLSAALDWKDALSARLQREIDHEGLGRLVLYKWQEGIGVEQRGFGVVLAHASGQFLCLVENPAAAPAGRMRNLFGLAQLITAEALTRQQLLFVHAGGCGLNGRCILLTGPSGAGKTTQALRLIREGATFYGDDQIVVGRNAEGRWTAWPYWRNIGITASTAQLLPWLPQPDKNGAGKEKFFFSAGEEFQFKKPGPARIEAIAWLSPTETELRKVDREEALACLGQHFLSVPWTADAGQVLGALCEMAEKIPVYIMPRNQLSVAAWKQIAHA